MPSRNDLLIDMADWLLANEDIDILPEALEDLLWTETGLMSLALMQMILEMEQSHGCTITNERLRPVRTFGDLATAFEEALAPPLAGSGPLTEGTPVLL